jgi:hypothetical protein
MIAVLSLASILAGGALAYVAERHPRHVALLEGGGGALLVAGLMLLGSGLSRFY